MENRKIVSTPPPADAPLAIKLPDSYEPQVTSGGPLVQDKPASPPFGWPDEPVPSPPPPAADK